MAGGFKIAEGYMDVTADSSKARREIDGFFRDVNGRLHDARGRFATEGQIAGEEWADRLDKAADRKSRQSFGGLAQKFGKRFLALGGMAGRLFANGFVLKAVAGLAALPTALSVTGALVQGLAQIGGAIGALAPATIGAAAFSLVTLKLAFSGFGDALKAGLAGDTEKLAEALKKLAPSAQQAARALISLAPAARALKRNVQEDFFAPWVRDIKPLALTYLPILSQRMAALANFAGTAVRDIIHLFTPPPAAEAFADMLDNFVTAFGSLSSMVPGLVSGFFNLASAGSSWIAKLSAGFGGLGDAFSAWSADFVDSGRFDAFVGRGLTLLGQVKDALIDVFGIVNKIFSMVPGGGGIFAALGQLADGLNRFLETAQGQQVITGFFARLQTLAGLIMDLVKGALPGLLAVSDGLLKGFQALAPVAGPVGQAIGEALSALAPILPLLGNLLAPILQLAATLLRVLAAELGPIIKLFSDMANQVLPLLLPMLDQLASQVLPLAADAGRQIAEAFAPLVPLWVELATTVSGQLMRYMPAFLEVSKQLVPVFVQVGQILAETWLVAFEQLRPHIPFLIQLFAALVLTAAQLLSWYVRLLPIVITVFSWFIKAAAWVMGLVLSIRHLPGAIAGAVAAFWGWLKGVGSAIGGFFVQVGQWFAALPGRIWTFLQQIPTMVRTALTQAFDAFFYWLGYITVVVIQFAVSIPERLRNMWNSIIATLSGAITAVGQWFSELPMRAALYFSQLYQTVTDWVSKTYNSIVGWLSALPGRVGSFFSDVWNRARSTTVSGVNSVISTVRTLPGRIVDALSGAARWLYGVGSDIVHGLINGFLSALDWAIGIVKRAMDRIKKGAMDALNIGSPSKAFARDVGEPIPAGIIQGIRKGMPDLERLLQVRVGGLTGAAGAQVNVAAPNVAVGGPTVMVMLDGEEIGARVVTPQRVARVNAEGNRRRDFLNTGRAATA